mmetsp:Transcript_26688/g.53382  ORF Transcript_26688/g.53382 Transcript_26688/m.53382 type:complete len:496 (+) Transcript_26688:44-1531(+)
MAVKKLSMKPKAKAKAGSGAQKPKRVRRVYGLEEARAATKMTSAQWKAHQVGMAEKWPQPEYMDVEMPGRSHTAYRDETYEIITRWAAETKIAYRPHAKAPGTKSHVRYEKYSRAKTVAQALKLGSWPADWCWDYERGFIKVLGPVRDEPLDISKVTDDSQLTDVDTAIYRWYRRELARNLGLRLEDLVVGKGSGESLIMRAHRLVAQREAKKALDSARKAKRKVKEDDVLKVLQAWAFARNPNRQNVMPKGQEWVWSDTLGLIRDRVGDIHITLPTKTYPEVAQLFNQYLLDRLPQGLESFKWTSLNVNCNYAAKLHRDGNNFGPSFIKAFGDFTGGRLKYWPEDDRQVDKLDKLKESQAVEIDLKNNLALFSGNCAHAVGNFTGERYSIVYFTVGCYALAPKECKDALQAMGMQVPSPNEDPFKFLRRPQGYGSRGRTPEKGKSGKPTYQAFPCAVLDQGHGAKHHRVVKANALAAKLVKGKSAKAEKAGGKR